MAIGDDTVGQEKFARYEPPGHRPWELEMPTELLEAVDTGSRQVALEQAVAVVFGPGPRPLAELHRLVEDEAPVVLRVADLFHAWLTQDDEEEG